MVTVDTWSFFYKPLEADGAKTAVLLMNQGNSTQDLTLTFADIPGVTCTSCAVRDVWSREDLGTFDSTYTASALAGHDAAFLTITPAESQA